MLTKICKGCGSLFPYGPGAYCRECSIARRGERHRLYDDKVRDTKAAAFYHSEAWVRLRDLTMQRAGGMCEECRRRGVLTPAEEVHHKVPIADDWSSRLDPDNLICLCRSCHRQAHTQKREEEGFRIPGGC